jgi:hypothetical protein
MTDWTDADARKAMALVRNIARLAAQGDRSKDGGEAVWTGKYAAAQLWEIIYSARLIAPADALDGTAFHEPWNRPDDDGDCVRTFPD